MKDENTNFNFNDCTELLYDIVDKKLNISKEEILSIKKTRTFADARRVIVKILKLKFPYATVAALGKVVNKDHSSVSVQLKKHDDLIFSNNDYTFSYKLISEEFYAITYSDLYVVKHNLEDRLKNVNALIEELENKKKLETSATKFH